MIQSRFGTSHITLASAIRLMAADGVLSKPFDPDASLDDIEDLADFAVFPSGAIIVSMDDWERKDIGTHPGAFVFHLTFKSALEWTETLDGVTEKYPETGAKMDVNFMTDNETGPKFLKKFLQAARTKFGTNTTTETSNAMKGCEMAIVGLRTPAIDKDTKQVVPGKYYYKVVNVHIP